MLEIKFKNVDIFPILLFFGVTENEFLNSCTDINR